MDLISAPVSVRRQLSQKFDVLPIFKQDRDTALYHLASALEMTTAPFTADLDLAMALGRRALDVSMRAIPAIYRSCSIPSLALEVEFSPAVFEGPWIGSSLHFATTRSCTALSWPIAANSKCAMTP